MKSGDKIRKPYPFISWISDYIDYSGNHDTTEGWSGGCRSHEEDGPDVYHGQCLQETFYTCDAEGEIEYEVLAVVEMPRKYQTRILYRVTMIEPEGNERRSSKAHTVTMDKFMSWIEASDSSYPHEYEIEDKS